MAFHETTEAGDSFHRRRRAVVDVYGNPGIAKSRFLDYALYRLLASGCSVLYLRGPGEEAYVFRPSPAPEGLTKATVTRHDLLTALRDGAAADVDIILFDPHEESEERMAYLRHV